MAVPLEEQETSRPLPSLTSPAQSDADITRAGEMVAALVRGLKPSVLRETAGHQTPSARPGRTVSPQHSFVLFAPSSEEWKAAQFPESAQVPVTARALEATASH